MATFSLLGICSAESVEQVGPLLVAAVEVREAHHLMRTAILEAPMDMVGPTPSTIIFPTVHIHPTVAAAEGHSNTGARALIGCMAEGEAG